MWSKQQLSRHFNFKTYICMYVCMYVAGTAGAVAPSATGTAGTAGTAETASARRRRQRRACEQRRAPVNTRVERDGQGTGAASCFPAAPPGLFRDCVESSGNQPGLTVQHVDGLISAINGLVNSVQLMLQQQAISSNSQIDGQQCLSRETVCRYNLLGQCRFGNNCWYRHSEGGVSTTRVSPSNGAHDLEDSTNGCPSASAGIGQLGVAELPEVMVPPSQCQTSASAENSLLAAVTSKDQAPTSLWTAISKAPVAEVRPTTFLQHGSKGHTYQVLYDGYLRAAKVIVLTAPYLLQPCQVARLDQFLDVSCSQPLIEQILVCTDSASGDDPRCKVATARLKNKALLEGVRLDFVFESGLHWRDTFFIGELFTWKVECDRGLDHLQGWPGPQPELERARRTKIQATKIDIGCSALAKVLETLVPSLEDSEQVSDDVVQELAATCTLARLQRKVRAARSLRQRLASEEALDPWQRRKARRLPVFLAALRLSKATSPTVPHKSPLDEQSDSSDDNRALALAEVVRDCQRNDPIAWKRWSETVAQLGFNYSDPRKYNASLLHNFLQRLWAHHGWAQVPKSWLAPHADVLKAEGLDEKCIGIESSASLRCMSEECCSRRSVDVRSKSCQARCVTSFTSARRTPSTSRVRSPHPTLPRVPDTPVPSPEALETVERPLAQCTTLPSFPLGSAGSSVIRGRSLPRSSPTKLQHRNVFLGNLGNDVTDDYIRSLCAPLGNIESCCVEADKHNSTRQFALVEFYRLEEAEHAIAELRARGFEARSANRPSSRSGSRLARRPLERWVPRSRPQCDPAEIAILAESDEDCM